MRALVVWLLVACCALAGPIRGPSEVKVDVGRLAPVPLEFDGDEIEYAILGGDYFGGFREFSDPKTFRFQLLGYAPGTGYIVVGTVKGGKLQPLFQVKVIVGDGKPPAPPVPPTPPAPDDPELNQLAFTLKQAASTDAWHPSKLKATATGYRNAANAIQPGTVADVMKALKAQMGAALNAEDVSPTVHATLTDRMNATLPRTGSMDAAAIAKARTLFLRLATALERAAQ